ncbi:VanZ family protein [Isoptericola halotolerans]|uniref:VanZ family protein n=1 Tax=Isoptericola halotolerans TaxID=300560 RepID=UPI0038903FD3
MSTASALAASLLIELTQYTGIYGLIGCSYRVADVDDVLTNTLGGLLGALMAPLVLRWMPQPRELAGSRLDPRPVTVWRRWLGMVVDLFAVSALAGARRRRPPRAGHARPAGGPGLRGAGPLRGARGRRSGPGR